MEMHEGIIESPSMPEQVRKLGHQRFSSSGKLMPVTSLILSYPSPTKNYNSLSRDGLSPDFEKTSIFFESSDTEDEVNESSVGISKVITKSIPVIKLSEDTTNETQEESNHPPIVTKIVFNDEESGMSTAVIDYCNDCAQLPELSTLQCHAKCKSYQFGQQQHSKKDLEDYASESNSYDPKLDKFHLKAPNTRMDEKRNEFLNELLNAAANDDVSNDNHDDDQDESGELRAEEFTMKDFREKFAIADALAKTSMMTSPAAKRRLAARKIEMELDGGEFEPIPGDDDKDYIPPRQLLLYLVRMGSFNSAPKINNPDSQDDSVEVPKGLSTTGLMQYCKMMRGENHPQLLDRYFLKPNANKTIISTDITDGLRVLKLDAVSKVCSAPGTSPNQLRILQWNILSQCLGQNNDGFVKCPEEALTWEHRKYLIVEEIVRNNPDIICLQEVDHFKFLERMLGTQNYSGIFFPKPDSPCLYIQDNNGPDGCAIFYKRNKLELINFDTRVLEVWRVQSNQVAIVANLRVNETGKEISICTTHLKARNGALLSKLRNEQGKDLLRFVNAMGQGRPVVMCGDFNAEPIEPIYSTVLNNKTLGLSSAYADLNEIESIKTNKECNGNAISNENACDDTIAVQELNPAENSANREPPYTTWKIREEGEVCHTIDYIFYSQKYLKVNNCLQFPQGNEIGINRTPSFQYPSDHFALVCDLEFRDDSMESNS